jgi:hypothetical protein
VVVIESVPFSVFPMAGIATSVWDYPKSTVGMQVHGGPNLKSGGPVIIIG